MELPLCFKVVTENTLLSCFVLYFNAIVKGKINLFIIFSKGNFYQGLMLTVRCSLPKLNNVVTGIDAGNLLSSKYTQLNVSVFSCLKVQYVDQGILWKGKVFFCFSLTRSLKSRLSPLGFIVSDIIGY